MAPSSINVGPNQHLSEYAVRVVARRVETLAFLVEKGARGSSVVAVHQLRVAARRLCSALDAFADHFPTAGVTKVLKNAKHLRNDAGTIRDRDSAVGLAAEIGLTLSEKAMERIHNDRNLAANELRQRLSRLSRKSPGSEWSRILQLTGRGTQTPGPIAATYAAALLPDLANEYFDAGHEAVSPLAKIKSLHAFRIRGKQFRYTLEIFSPCYGRNLQDALQLLRGIQDILGMINDCETAAAILTEAIGRHQRRQVQSLLVQRQEALIGNFRSHWNETFSRDNERRTWVRMLTKPAFSIAGEALSNVNKREATSDGRPLRNWHLELI